MRGVNATRYGALRRSDGVDEVGEKRRGPAGDGRAKTRRSRRIKVKTQLSTATVPSTTDSVLRY